MVVYSRFASVRCTKFPFELVPQSQRQRLRRQIHLRQRADLRPFAVATLSRSFDYNLSKRHVAETLGFPLSGAHAVAVAAAAQAKLFSLSTALKRARARRLENVVS